MIPDKQARDQIAAALASAANEECIDQWSGLAQEPALTARIGKALESKLSGDVIKGYEFKVVTQDFPDRGRGALESKVGADLYVGIEVIANGARISKGFIAQAKWRYDTSGQDRLARQCDDMLARTSAAYVWFYGDDGITFLPADQVRLRTDRTMFRGRPLADEFAAILECSKGDEALGLPTGLPIRKALAGMMQDMAARSGVGVLLRKRRQRVR